MTLVDLDGFRDALRTLVPEGVEVQARQRLAVVRSAGAIDALIARRREVVDLARRHGFTHACVEVD